MICLSFNLKRTHFKSHISETKIKSLVSFKIICFVPLHFFRSLFGLHFLSSLDWNIYLPLVVQSSEENPAHTHTHPGYASLRRGPQLNLSRSIQWELVYYFYVRNYRDRAVTTTPAQITKIYLGVNNIDCTFV